MLVTYGQRKIAELLGIPGGRLAIWLRRYDDWPAPDSGTENPDKITLGWLPERLPEWRAYAEKRAARAVQYGKDPERLKTRTKTTEDQEDMIMDHPG